MNIRVANSKDAEIIARLAKTTFDETFGYLFLDRQVLLDYFDVYFNVDKIRQGLQKENNVFWLAFVDEKPVGYSKLKVQSPSDFVDGSYVSQLQKIYVLKDYLSMKIGLELQESLLKKARDLGSKHIWLSVFEDNRRAIRFYIKNGFVEVGKHQFQIGKYIFDFIAMSKQL